jgi:AraC-like DNA-binding protein
MLPDIDGFEVCRRIRSHPVSGSVPVIMLTARKNSQDIDRGVQTGADAYISKPFSMTHLMLQINKLIEKREKLHKHYASTDIPAEVGQQPVDHELDIPDRDNQFLKLVEQILEKHLTDPEFNVDEFAQMAFTGRTLFFKKIKYLTGYSPNEFIRFRRMKKAAELLKTYKYNVSEVSYMVGINDPFYFSKCFKAQYGCSPSHYINS